MRVKAGLVWGSIVVVALVAAALISGGGTDGAAAASATGISSGEWHSCAVTAVGGVQCWGYNETGELGVGEADGPEVCGGGFSDEYFCSETPLDVVGLSSGVEAIEAGDNHTCALMTTGGVKCWGASGAGQLGNGDSVGPETCFDFFSNPCSSSPVDVTGLSSGVEAITAGGAHTCALMEGGALKCWGSNFLGQLGVAPPDLCDGIACATTPIDVPLTGVEAVSAGGAFTCAVVNGGAKCWGQNITGQLGNGTHTQTGPIGNVTGLSDDVEAISAGGGHTCAIVLGAVKCWGADGHGQLGIGTVVGGCSALPGDLCGSSTPVDVPGLSGVDSIDAGGEHTCVLRGGGVMCWGNNAFGEVGNGMTGPDTCVNGFKCQPTPADAVGLSGTVVEVSPGDDHTCARNSEGGIQCWGRSFFGALGAGDLDEENQFEPIDVTGLEGTTPTPSPSPTPAGIARLWADADCDGGMSSRDNQAIQRFVLQQNPLGQTEPCPDIGTGVDVAVALPASRPPQLLWADADCDGTITTRDNQAVLRNVLQQNALSQTEPCPDVGAAVLVS